MRVFAVAIVAGSLIVSTVVLATVALAQSPATPAPAASPAATPPATAPAAAAVPAPGAKKLACQATSEALRGQAKKDQMQICMLQARLDCLKQAVEQNIVGPQRADFVKSCSN